MWMKLTLLLVGVLLIWDAASTERGQSTVSRGGAALMGTAPAQELSVYVKDGAFVKDVKSLGKAAATTISNEVASNNVVAVRQDVPSAEQVNRSTVADLSAANDTLVKATAALEAEQAERRATLEKRRAELSISPEDVAKIAQAVNELYKQEQIAAAAVPPVEQSVIPTGPLMSVPGPVPSPDIVAEVAPVPMPAPEAAPSVEVVEKSATALGPDILGAIVKASKETGANSGYLLHIALRESGLVLGAQAPTSSATGPFQFIQQTWYQMIGVYGAKHKLDAEVALLSRQSNGSFKPVSEAARVELLTLRTDPYVAALMAGELTMENMGSMTKSLGRAPAHGELYAAHVLGASNAVLLVKTRDKAAGTSAAQILPQAAASNRWLFYSDIGRPRSVAALFDELSRFMTTREVATVCKANLDFFKS